MFNDQVKKLRDQVVNISGYSQQKSNNPKSFGKKSRNFDESLQTGVPDTLSMVSAAALWLSVPSSTQNYQLLCNFTLKSSEMYLKKNN